MSKKIVHWFLQAATVAPLLAFQLPAQSPLGSFESQSDVGSVNPPGTATYDAAHGRYKLTAAGANLWSTSDGFHFLWKKVSGDVALTADIRFPDTTGNPSPHRKAVLMFRQSLDDNGIYTDAAQHGSGMTALQYRRANGATTQDIELNIDAPRHLRLEKRGDVFTMFLSMGTEPLHQVGASIKLHLDGPFYAGLGVCSHNKDVIEKAVFSNVELTRLDPLPETTKTALYSTLQITGIEDNFRRAVVVLSDRGQVEAPNWTRDGNALIFNRDGLIWKIPTSGGLAEPIDIGAATHCGGSHGLSPDGKWLAISCTMPDSPETRVYILPSGGGAPRMVTANPLSWWHSWAPDGKTILFTRPGKGSLNIYSISVDGGPETALTSGAGISDDPDYSPDGNYIYFNSDRSGSMQIWRMHPDGSNPEQMTSDEMVNWTPHPSPDGKSVVFQSYEKGTTGHPANKDIALRILTPADKKVRTLVSLVGGTGSMNVPSWAPDGSHLAFVSYQMLPEESAGSH